MAQVQRTALALIIPASLSIACSSPSGTSPPYAPLQLGEAPAAICGGGATREGDGSGRDPVPGDNSWGTGATVGGAGVGTGAGGGSSGEPPGDQGG
ncbi:MAG TPA: hypothetical protein VL242_18990, partial [Sorangium sp.]|nr:hypothetical protein [Sorangium sp.]